MLKFYLLGLLFSFIWIAFEIYRAPMMDEETGRIIKEGKKLKDLFKKK